MKQLLALLLVTSLAACGVDESAIKPWVKQHFPGATYECMSGDSDGDGYVSEVTLDGLALGRTVAHAQLQPGAQVRFLKD